MLNFTPCANFIQIFSHLGCEEGVLGGAQTNAEDAAERPVGQLVAFLILQSGLHKLCYPGIRNTSTWSKFGAHGEHGDVFLFSNLGAL